MTIKELQSIHTTQICHLTEKINGLVDVMQEHDKVSQTYRRLTVVNKESISWMKQSLYGLYTIVSGVLIWVIASYIIK